MDLFEQLSAQQNFLLLSQRQMILVSAFAVALFNYKNTLASKKYPRQKLFSYISFILFAYAIATGIKAAVDFRRYANDTKKELAGKNDELQLLDRAEEWMYFSYLLIVLVVVVMFTFYLN
jgi:uncharacterized membrane protein YidH (DUF202 family)